MSRRPEHRTRPRSRSLAVLAALTVTAASTLGLGSPLPSSAAVTLVQDPPKPTAPSAPVDPSDEPGVRATPSPVDPGVLGPFVSPGRGADKTEVAGDVPRGEHSVGVRQDPRTDAQEEDERTEIESAEPAVPSPSASSSFAGISDTGWMPPDTNGAVGPDHVLTVVNGGFQIQDRSGNVLEKESLNDFFAAVNPSDATHRTFDPHTLYDAANGRWIVVATANPDIADSAVVLAVSRGADPTGDWYRWSIDADTNDDEWADYPLIGLNRNWLVISLNMFQNGGGGFTRPKIIALERPNLYAGTATRWTWDGLGGGAAQFGFTISPAVTLDEDQGTEYLVRNYGAASDGRGYVAIHSITGTTGSAPNLSAATYASVASPWAERPAALNSGPQANGPKLNTGDARMGSVVYRSGSLWATHGVFLPATAPTRGAVQWWNLRPDGTVLQHGRIEDSTNAKWFVYPSLAVNAAGDALLGYSRMGTDQYPSANYSLHVAADGPSTMREDTVLKAGEAPYSRDDKVGRNRWGDYSKTWVDPVDDTSFWTVQEYAESPANTWGTWWGRVYPTTPSRPVNDDFAAATVWTPAKGNPVAGTNVGATKQAGEPLHATVTGGKSVWWRYSATTSGPVTIDTRGSTFDTVLGVYTGTSVEALTEVASNDDEDNPGGIRTSALQFNAVAGTTYHLAVDGYAAESGSITMTITVSGAQPPGAPTDVTAVPGDARADVSWTAPATTGGSPITSYTVTSSPGGHTCAWTAGPLTCSVTGLVNNESYTFTVRATNDAGTGPASTPSAAVVPLGSAVPPNDEFAAATVWTVDDGNPSTGTTTGATKQAGEPAHAGNAGGHSTWWRFTPAVSGRVRIDLEGSTFDTLLGVYTGGSVGDLVQVAANDDAIAGKVLTSLVEFDALAGTSYSIAVDGYGGASGAVRMAITAGASATVPGPPGDVHATPGVAQATVGWGPPASDGGSPVTGYTVTSSPGARTCVWISGPLTCTVTGLTNGTPYTFTVQARNALGTGPSSAPSAAVTPTGAAPANDDLANASELPEGLVTPVLASTVGATREAGEPSHAGDGGGSSAWWYFRPAQDADVSLSLSGSGFDTLLAVYTGSSVSSLTEIESNDDESYPDVVTSALTFRARAGVRYAVAVDGWGGASGPVRLTLSAPPSAPTGVQAVAGDQEVTLSWGPPVQAGIPALTGYQATATPGGSTCQTTTTTCRFTGLTNDQPYTFTVVALAPAGSSPPAVAGPVTPRGATPPTRVPPSAPRHVTATAGDRAATVSWQVPEAVGSDPVVDYTVTAFPGGSTCVTAQLTCRVTGLANGQSHTFVVTARSAAGTSAASAPSSPVTPLGTTEVRVRPRKNGTVLFVDVDPSRGRASWKFSVEKRVGGRWRALRTFRTRGTRETRVVDLPKGVYRVRVPAQHGHRATRSRSVRLRG